MTKKPWNRAEVIIDESKQTTAPTIFQKIKHILTAILMGIIFAQVMLFAFMMGSIIYIWLYSELALGYLLVCAILGWFYGEKFIQTLGKESENWWDLWRGWYW